VRLDGNGIRSRMGGRQFHLEMGRLDQQGSNRLINTVIELHADGTSAVKLTHYFYQTYHSDYSSTRSESGTGNWWIEGDRWCHRSPIINYGTKDCYDITVDVLSSVFITRAAMANPRPCARLAASPPKAK